MVRKEQISSVTHPELPRRKHRVIVNPVDVFEMKHPYDPLVDLQERIRFRIAFEKDAKIEADIQEAIDGGVVDRIRERVIAEYPFIKQVWGLKDRYDNDPNSRG